jgi:hypothetical protein
VLWQHVFQVVVCVMGAVQCVTLACNFSQAQCKLPENGQNGPKHEGVNIRCFNVNFNILYV